MTQMPKRIAVLVPRRYQGRTLRFNRCPSTPTSGGEASQARRTCENGTTTRGSGRRILSAGDKTGYFPSKRRKNRADLKIRFKSVTHDSLKEVGCDGEAGTPGHYGP